MKPTDPPRTYPQLTESRILGSTGEVNTTGWPHPDAWSLVDSILN